MPSRKYDDILNDFARRSLDLGTSAYVPELHRVLDAKCKRLVHSLASDNKYFPPNLALDLFLANKVGASGSRFKDIPHHELWEKWLRTQWIPVVQGFGPDDLEHLLRQMARSDAEDGGGRSSKIALDGVARLRQLDKDPESCWSCPTGQAILDVIERNAPLRDLVTQSALIELKAKRPRSDSLYGASLVNRHNEVQDRSDVGTASGGNRSEVIESFAGKFLSRHPGSLPSNIGRLSPVELLYFKRAKRLFLLRVAESSLDQRFFEMHLHSNRVMAIRVHLAMAEDECMYQSPETGRSSRHRYRSLYIDLLKSLIVAGQDVNVDLTIVASHETMFENDRLEVAFGSEEQADLQSCDQHRLAVELSAHMPNLFSEWPAPNSIALSSAPSYQRQGYDKEIDLVLATPGRSVRRLSPESEVYRVWGSDDGAWHVRNAGPMHAQGLIDWVMQDVFAASEGFQRRRRLIREVEFAS